MIECCGQERDSRFCPECGRQLQEPDPLHGLVMHCRRVALRNEKEADAFRDQAADNPDMADDRTALAGDKDAAAAKWKAWADHLEALLAGKPPNE